jgi:hypothetical protein
MTTDLTLALVAHGECWMFVNSNRYTRMPGKNALSLNAFAPYVSQITLLFSTLFRPVIPAYKLGFKLDVK